MLFRRNSVFKGLNPIMAYKAVWYFTFLTSGRACEAPAEHNDRTDVASYLSLWHLQQRWGKGVTRSNCIHFVSKSDIQNGLKLWVSVAAMCRNGSRLRSPHWSLLTRNCISFGASYWLWPLRATLAQAALHRSCSCNWLIQTSSYLWRLHNFCIILIGFCDSTDSAWMWFTHRL
jgi:hypothetical protein